jgi:uncharacterized protein YdeI (YjbR/CyaY-like superfamily)
VTVPVPGGPTTPAFFATSADLRAWLKANHATAAEVLVGFHRKGSGRPSITWPEAVDEALCVGWIDGVRRSLDETSYTIRFTPRRKGSIWSAVNIGRVAALREAGLMQPSGEAAFEARKDAKSAIYAYERPPARLDAEAEASFRASGAAWDWFHAQAPSYRRTATYWVTSAKRPETRARRLATLIEDSAAGRRIGPLTYVRKEIS